MSGRLLFILLPVLAGIAVLGLAFDVVDLGALFGGGDDADDGYETELSMEAGETPVEAAPAAGLTGRATAESLAAAERRRLEAEARAAESGPDGGGADGPGVPFVGRVLDPQGRPAGGVKIEATRETGETFRLATDDEGRFKHALPPGRYRLNLSAPGIGYRLISRALIDGSLEDGFEFTLREPATFQLAVLRGEEGVAGVTVTLTPRGSPEEDAFSGTTDFNGVATFENLPRTRYKLAAEVPDGPRFTQDYGIWSDRTLKVQIPNNAVLKGVVRDGKDGPPVAGAAITLRVTPRGSRAEFESVFESGPDGSYEVSVPQGYVRHFAVEATGFATYPNPADRGERRTAFRVLNNLVRRKSVELTVPLRSGASVKGLVTDSEDNPIEGVALRLKARRGTFVTVTTDKYGQYAAAELNPDRYEVLVETAEWFAENRLQFNIPQGATEPVTFDFVLKGARRFEGVVLNKSGKGVYGARVFIIGGGRPVNSARQAGRPLETFTNDKGHWVLSDVPAERNVAVRASYGDAEAEPVWIRHDRPVPPSIRVELADTGSVKGETYDLSNRAPLSDVTIRVQPIGKPWGRSGRTVRVNREGKFQVDRLIPGKYAFTPTKAGYLTREPVEFDVKPGEEPQTLDLPLDPGLVFAGVVVDVNGKALPNTRIDVWGKVGEKTVRNRSVRTNAQGRFKLTGYERGTYTMRIRRGGAFQQRRIENLGGGESSLEIQLLPRQR